MTGMSEEKARNVLQNLQALRKSSTFTSTVSEEKLAQMDAGIAALTEWLHDPTQPFPQ